MHLPSNVLKIPLEITVETRDALLEALKQILDDSNRRARELEEVNHGVFLRENYLELLEVRSFARRVGLVINQLWGTNNEKSPGEYWRDHDFQTR